MTSPLNLITEAFAKGYPAFMPYFTLGYPDYWTSLDIVQSCEDAGADLMELGIPFSDPLADGPTIQNSTQIALENGMTVARSLEAISELRRRGVTMPLILMGYYNPILARGEERFVTEAAMSGVTGFIVPDLPPEEADTLDSLCRKHDLGMVYMVAPTSTEERIRMVAERARGFTYLVSLTGVTGARGTLPPELEQFVARVRQYVPTPIAVGFGISTPDHVREVGRIADGIIVGSKLINVADEADDPVKACGEFVREMVIHAREALQHPSRSR